MKKSPRYVTALLMLSLGMVAAAQTQPSTAPAPDPNYLKYDLPKNTPHRDISEAFPNDTDMHYAYLDANENILGTETISDTTHNTIERHLYKDGKLHGVQKTYFPDGKPKTSRPYQNGVLDGVCRTWDAKGQLIESSLIKHGTGTETLYYSSGNIDHISDYVNNQQTRVIALHPNGQLSFRSLYKDGHFAAGETFNFKPDGSLAAFVAMDENGKPHGPLLQWTDTGGIAQQLYFVHGAKKTQQEYQDLRSQDASLPAPLVRDDYAARIPADLKTLAVQYKDQKAATIPLQDIADP